MATAGLFIVAAASLAALPTAYAATTNMTQVIYGTANCSLDETHSGQTPQLSVQPESCQPHVDPTVPVAGGTSGTADGSAAAQGQGGTAENASVSPLATGNTVSAATQPLPVKTIETDAPGNQGLLENTVVEPLASWVGIGNPQASVSNPVIATTAVGTTTGLAIDAAFFQFATTKRVFQSGKRRAKTVGSVTRGLFRS